MAFPLTGAVAASDFLVDPGKSFGCVVDGLGAVAGSPGLEVSVPDGAVIVGDSNCVVVTDVAVIGADAVESSPPHAVHIPTTSPAAPATSPIRCHTFTVSCSLHPPRDPRALNRPGYPARVPKLCSQGLSGGTSTRFLAISQSDPSSRFAITVLL